VSKRHRPRNEVYVVLRADLFHSADTPLETLITAKAVLRSKDQAEQEVRRLNALHPDGRVRYWCAFSRLFADGAILEDRVDPARE
jgi:hypothetical protein